MSGSLIQLETQGLETQLLFNPTECRRVGRWVGLEVLLPDMAADWISDPVAFGLWNLFLEISQLQRQAQRYIQR